MPFTPGDAAYQPGRYPRYIQHKLGNTAEIPQGVGTGKKLQQVHNHLINFRYQGPVYMASHAPSTTFNDGTGTQYIILHYPPRTDAEDRKLAIAVGVWGYPATGSWEVKFRDGFGSGTWQSMVAGSAGVATSFTLDMEPQELYWSAFDVTPPAGTGGSGFKVVELANTNCLLSHTSAWWLPDASTPSEQVVCKPKDVAPATVIGNTGKSLDYLMGIIGDGTMNVESLERNTRRVFFNHGHPGGTLFPSGTAYANAYGSAKFGAGHRDLLDTGNDARCYPAAVITTTGQGSGNYAQMRITTTVGGASAPTWTYKVPSGLGVAPQLITYDAADATPQEGPHVKPQAYQSDAGDEVLVEGYTPAGATLTIHSVGLWEGPAW